MGWLIPDLGRQVREPQRELERQQWMNTTPGRASAAAKRAVDGYEHEIYPSGFEIVGGPGSSIVEDEISIDPTGTTSHTLDVPTEAGPTFWAVTVEASSTNWSSDPVDDYGEYLTGWTGILAHGFGGWVYGSAIHYTQPGAGGGPRCGFPVVLTPAGPDGLELDIRSQAPQLDDLTLTIWAAGLYGWGQPGAYPYPGAT